MQQFFESIGSAIQLEHVFTQLSLVLVVATLMALLMRRLKQPLIVGHILTGILVGPSLLGLIEDKHAFDTFSEIGIALLLFIIGLELSVAVLKRLGKPVLLTAAAIFSTVGVLGYLFGIAFHFTTTEAVLLGLALFFSSTIIIAKVLSDKKEITRLNGQIAIGVILVDDIVATFALLYVATASSGELLGPAQIGILLLKGALVVGAMALFAGKVLPKAVKSIAKSQELLFLFALAWGFGVATLFDLVGFSIEIGALFAGVALAHLPYAHQIGARLKPLRDFFVVLFFISLGENLNLESLSSALVPALLLSFMVLTLKPLVVMASLGFLGYTRRTSFKTGINLSQISEFSIILIVLAVNAGMVSDQIGSVVTIVALITIAISTYLMQYDNVIFEKIGHSLRMFERKGVTEVKQEARSFPLLLLGYEHGGAQFVETFKSLKKKFVVVDYDPEVIEELDRLNIDHLYGDVTDPELLAEINVDSLEMVVNTISEQSINEVIVEHIRKRNAEAVIVCYAKTHDEAAELYRRGATYVMLPNVVGSERLNTFISENGVSRKRFDSYREKHMMQIGRVALRGKDSE